MFEKLNGMIEMDKDEYYEMCDEYRDLQKENIRLEKEIERLEEDKEKKSNTDNKIEKVDIPLKLGITKYATLTINNGDYCLKEITRENDNITFVTKDHITDKKVINEINENYKYVLEFESTHSMTQRNFYYKKIADLLQLQCNRFSIRAFKKENDN